jgi:hypothetical protein
MFEVVETVLYAGRYVVAHPWIIAVAVIAAALFTMAWKEWSDR